MVRVLSTTKPCCISSEYKMSQDPSIEAATITASNIWKLYFFTKLAAKNKVPDNTGIMVQAKNGREVCTRRSSLGRSSNLRVVLRYSEITWDDISGLSASKFFAIALFAELELSCK